MEGAASGCMQLCGRCNQEKPATEFVSRRGPTSGMDSTYCNACKVDVFQNVSPLSQTSGLLSLCVLVFRLGSNDPYWSVHQCRSFVQVLQPCQSSNESHCSSSDDVKLSLIDLQA